MKVMSKTLVGLAVLVGFSVLIGAAAAQFARPQDAIKYRKSVMFIISQHFSRLGAMVKGAQTYDQDTFADNASIVETLSALPWEAFLAAGSDRGDTTMKSSVLKNPAEFKDIAQNFRREIGSLARAANGGDLDAVRPQFGVVAKSCKDCHSKFRK
jgi:cytochrome c556